MSAVITGMLPYPTDRHQGGRVATAFTVKGPSRTTAWCSRRLGALIAVGGLAGMTSVLLITFLSQARIFLAMARDG